MSLADPFGTGRVIAPRAFVPSGLDPSAVLTDERRLAMLPSGVLADAPALMALAAVAAATLQAPRALVSLVTASEQQVLASFGLPVPPEVEPIERAICGYTVALGEPLMLADLTQRGSPDAAALDVGPTVRAYAGVALRIAGERVGTLCVTDTRSRAWTLQDAQRLEALAGVGDHLLALAATT